MFLVGAGLGLGWLGQVFAHGWTADPPARQFICGTEGGQFNGNIPNAACRAAYAVTNDPAVFIQKNEYSTNVRDYENPAAVRNAVLDGLLCSGGRPAYRGMSIGHPDWKKTSVPANGGNYNLKYFGTAPHYPSYYEIYISRPGFDSSRQTLGWGDVEKLGRFDVRPVNGTFSMNINLPSGRSGQTAVLFTRWQRIDIAGEGFYDCADIVFGSPSNNTDNTPPSISLTSSSTNVTSAGTITLNANASDNIGVNRVEFYRGSTKLGEDFSAPYTQSLNLSSADNGMLTLSARAFDTAGNNTSSSVVNVSVNIGGVVNPTGPVCFYETPNFSGERFCSDKESNWVGAVWNDRISSVKVASGYQVVLYQHTNFGGTTVKLTGDNANLSNVGFDNTTSSFVVSKVVIDPGNGGSWVPNTSYSVGASVTYGGLAYTCRQAHTSLLGWEPPNVPALWLLK
jgi:predicted carbohydrate-binding protein with CBM5 and CBM33 domain